MFCIFVLLFTHYMTLQIIQNNYSDHHTQPEVPILIWIGHIPNIIWIPNTTFFLIFTLRKPTPTQSGLPESAPYLDDHADI